MLVLPKEDKIKFLNNNRYFLIIWSEGYPFKSHMPLRKKFINKVRGRFNYSAKTADIDILIGWKSAFEEYNAKKKESAC